MALSDPNFASVVVQRPSIDAELTLIRIEESATGAGSYRSMMPGGVTRLLGHIVYGRAFRPMTEVIAEAGHFCQISNSRYSGIMSKAARHALTALRHAALARTTLLAVVIWCVLVAVTLLAHETHNTERIHQHFLANPTVARAPRKAWGYTPVLSGLPHALKARLIAFDQSLEYRLHAFGVGRSKSGSSSVSSIKIGSTIMSLFGLIPLVQFGLGQHVKSRSRREKVVRIRAAAHAR